ncbi:MAG: ATP-binding protein [Syntrophaceae bacterium]|nr:ATP-binding protein [Syntrophaceae bacterium]
MMIKRRLFDDLKAHLNKKEISLIVGPRQAGKTTLMMLLIEHVRAQGKRTVAFNLDIESDHQFFGSQESLLRKIILELGAPFGDLTTGGGYVFIDEIQRKENAGLFLKGLYDMNLPYKFIVSGSGSLELKEKIHESLAGRKRIFELATLDFFEFTHHKTDYRYEHSLPEFFALDPQKAQSLLEEYLSFGGYPRVVLEETANEKRKIIAELYQSYLERDIAYLLGVQKTDRFTALARLMAAQIGQLANISEISSTLNLNAATVNNYLWYLEKTFLLHKVTPYFRNMRKELTKTPIFYFYDLGMRNYALGAFGAPLSPSEGGFLFQNFIHNLLRKKVENTSNQIHHWRTTNKAEVDFVLDKNTAVVPIEVKYRKLPTTSTSLSAGPGITRSFQNFVSAYHPSKGYMIHLGDAMQKTINSTPICFMNWWQLMFEEL